MKKVLIFFILSLISLLFPNNTKAIVDPILTSNNKFGIHIINENDLINAQYLVNSSGGDWGYITLVIREDERNIERWQKVFNEMRRRHLIPIIRLATLQEGNSWKKFSNEEIKNWVYFLNSLNWVIKNRYVIVGNEPNHADEWGGDVNPEEYATILCNFYNQLKQASDDFFVLPAGLDASAPTKNGYLSEEKFLSEAIKKRSDFFSCFDGWTSHSYPNPNFSGSEKETGRQSIKTYIWEESILKSLGQNRNLPIFITETGWIHNGENPKNKLLSPSDIGKKLTFAFQSSWIEKNIVSVTPFVLNYQDLPFNQFSWTDKNGNFYPFFYEVKSLPKIKGEPVQEENGEINFSFIPKISLLGKEVNALILIKNKGQSIWEENSVEVISSLPYAKSLITQINKVLEPGQSSWVSIRISIPDNFGNYSGKISLIKNNQYIANDYYFQIVVILPSENTNSYLLQLKENLLGWLTKRIRH